MALKYIEEADLSGKRVIARFDFNVPLRENGTIADSTRIDEALPTIRYLLSHGVTKLILMSHLGRPKGGPEKKYTLEPVASYLADALKEEVILTESAIDAGIPQLLNLQQTRIVLLENIRFHPEEEQNSHEFAKKLAGLGDIYVNDAFGAAHRKHASTYEINAFFKGKSYGGMLVRKELEALNKISERPVKPFMAVLGGAKVSDKIKTIERFLVSVDALIIGGAMAYPFLKAQGREVGKSLCSAEDVALAKKVLSQKSATKILLPLDHIVASSPSAAKGEFTAGQDIPSEMMGLDIGPQSIRKFSQTLENAKTVFWNGPMGLFEKAPFAEGTQQIAKVLSDLQAFTLVGGGDSVTAVKSTGLEHKFSHISTGGGASLEYLEQGTLPGIAALKFGL